MTRRLVAVLLLFGCGAPSPAPAPPPAPEPDAAVAPAPVGPPRAWTTTADEDRPPTARPGDLMLGTTALRAAVAGPTHAVGPLDRGALVALHAFDEAQAIGGLVPVLDATGARVPLVDEVRVVQVGRGAEPGIVRAVGRDRIDDQLEVAVDYVVEPEADALRVMLTLTNRGRSFYRDQPVGVLIDWGTLAPRVPEAPLDLIGQETHSDWIGAESAAAALLVSAETGRLRARHGDGWSVVLASAVDLPPDAVEVREFRLRAGGRRGLAPLVADLARARGTVIGEVRGVVLDEAGQPLSGAEVSAFDGRGRPGTSGRAGPDGRFTLHVPPGTWHVAARTSARAPTWSGERRVTHERPLELTLKLGPRGALVATVHGPEAARLRLEPEKPTPWLAVPPPAYVGPEGRALAVPPGRWRAVFEAGPRFEAVRRDLRIEGRTGFDVTLAPAIDASGWAALDTHVPARRGPIAPRVDPRGWCRAAGVDAVVLIDRGVAPDPGEGRPTVFAGVERAPLHGHFVAFPVAAGTEVERRRSPAEQVEALRAAPGAPLVMALRPRAPEGYFERFRFDPAAEQLPRGGFTLDFELLEVADGPSGHEAVGDWLRLARELTPVAGSGMAATGRWPCGTPRTWVPAWTLASPTALTDALRRGAVVLSYGPLIDLKMGDAGPGDVAPAGERTATIRVQAPAWARPDRLELLLEGQVVRSVRIRGKGPLDRTWKLKLPGRLGRVVARVDGARELAPVLGGAARPFAITGPVRVGARPETRSAHP